ncbi:2,4-dihydroxyhept-2-ene-1,7-dioic acid aldolase [Skermanella rosea]|uniref:HpcH/HpaI aldolase family protein n=1 Tax=Skermanella rosea TaxID=1817965 RepID=UPI0019342E37|nr:aldolase/citrate lyase family protein [Skermanella rosea]UEM05604.1 2,4-dihydroxyhept-2-ene-1,7-dioic acid aldolase [Skermanella rosea]
MKENRLRSIWRDGGSALNCWLSIPDGYAAETMAHQGWDSLTVDMQHGVIDYRASVAMMTAISTTATAPLVRVPWLDEAYIMKALDAGAAGVICPMVNSRAEAERLVGACRYPPQGHRSFGPNRAMLTSGGDYPEHANADVVVFAMIETKEALENLDDILGTPGLDAIYVGPADLCYALTGRFGFDHTEPPLYDAIVDIRERAAARGVMPGIHCGSAAYARRMIELGYRFVTGGSDVHLMAAGARAAVLEATGHGTSPEAPSERQAIGLY